MSRFVSPYVRNLLFHLNRFIQVTLVYRPRVDFSSHQHEKQHSELGAFREIQYSTWSTFPSALRNVMALPTCPTLFLGYSDPFQQVLLGALRCTSRRRLWLAGDANAVDLDPTSKSFSIKRWILPRMFDGAFALGTTNRMAWSMLGFERIIDQPILVSDFNEMDTAGRSIELEMKKFPAPRILCLARMVEKKNHAALLSAADKLKVPIFLGGDGPLRSSLARFSGARFLGAIPSTEVAGAIRGADLVVLPSKVEPWGIAVIEALGLGIPVLASDRVGAAVSLKREFGGAISLVPPDRESLRSGLAEGIRMLDHMKLAAERASPTIRDRYGVDQVARHLASIFTRE